MKKLIIAFAFLGALLFVNCEQEQVVYNGTAVGLSARTAPLQLSVPTTGLNTDIPVSITTLSDEVRTFGIEYVGDAPAAGGVTLGMISVPANSYEGTATINFDFNAINLDDGITDTFSVKATSENTDVIANVINIEYFKAIICNDATLTLTTDRFAEETGFTITNDATGAVEYTMPPLVRGVQTFTADIFLADGCYTATVTDSYGDGQTDGTVIGGYTITCSILTFASGGGANIGSSESMSFCVNQ